MAALEAIEVEELDTLDLSSYKCIYISFGSINGDGKKPFYQDFPYFLEEINKYPLCVISIDKYPDFTREERVIPFNMVDSDPRQRYTHITVPSHTMDNTIGITEKLVELLDKNEAQVFFVNFIKYRDKNAHDAGPETEAMKLLSHLGKYRDHYYDWYGFGLFKDFIIKNTHDDMLERIKGLLAVKDTSNSTFLTSLKDDNLLKRTVRHEIYTGLRSHLIDITYEITPEQIALLHPEFTAGKRTRKRRRRRKTRRR